MGETDAKDRHWWRERRKSTLAWAHQIWLGLVIGRHWRHTVTLTWTCSHSLSPHSTKSIWLYRNLILLTFFLHFIFFSFWFGYFNFVLALHSASGLIAQFILPLCSVSLLFILLVCKCMCVCVPQCAKQQFHETGVMYSCLINIAPSLSLLCYNSILFNICLTLIYHFVLICWVCSLHMFALLNFDIFLADLVIKVSVYVLLVVTVILKNVNILIIHTS